MSGDILYLGHNAPPGPIDYAQSVVDDINVFLTDHPTIQSEEDAREAKPHPGSRQSCALRILSGNATD